VWTPRELSDGSQEAIRIGRYQDVWCPQCTKRLEELHGVLPMINLHSRYYEGVLDGLRKAREIASGLATRSERVFSATDVVDALERELSK
jgi:hypothetical protein